ncbi:unnamed protein product [Dibothriocephalus latus]|uniref:Uncharacterized protein n=1 Tax=Dibothriocephalus latus TaxID=60516 RepID=A0A3P7MBW1_DIBLA|nr:unnamed protein product [Dibothriocephalus latus]
MSNKKERPEEDIGVDDDAEATGGARLAPPSGPPWGLETQHRCVWSSASVCWLNRRRIRRFASVLTPRGVWRSDPDKVISFEQLNYITCWCLWCLERRDGVRGPSVNVSLGAVTPLA